MPDKVRRAVEGLGDLIDGYEFHYPQELSSDNLDAVRERARRPRHLLRGQRPAPRPALRQGRARRHPTPAMRDEALRLAAEAADFAGGSARTSSSGPGSRATTTRSRRPTRTRWALAHRRHRRRPPSAARARRQALPRAQELRAGDEDPHAQHRDDAARDPQAPRRGHRQRPGQHGLAAPDHERREPGEYAALLAAEGLLGHQHANSGWGTFDDDNMVGATAFMETLELALELRRAGYGNDGERLGLRPLPVHRGPGRRGAPLGAAVALHRRRRGAHRRCRAARGAAGARTRSAPTSSCTPRSGA